MNQPAHRFHELDFLRGLACAAVVLFHYLSRGPRANWMTDALYPAVDAVTRYGYLGVHLFFVISGFVILMSAARATPREFVASRVARLYPALWVGAAITAVTAWLLADEQFTISLPHFLVNLTMVPHWFNVPYVDGAYWSLAVELHFYIYVWIAMRLKQMHRLEWLLCAWLAVAALNALRPAWPIEFWLNAKWAPLFVAGGTCYLVRSRGYTRLHGALLFVSWALAVFYAVRAAAPDSHAPLDAAVNPWIVAAAISAIFAVFIAIAFDCWRMTASRITRMAGTLTYPVYVVHQIFGFMLYERLRVVVKSAPVALAITTGTVVLIGWAIHRYVEKTSGPQLRNWLAGKP